jgi:ribosomal protein S15P/S13E
MKEDMENLRNEDTVSNNEDFKNIKETLEILTQELSELKEQKMYKKCFNQVSVQIQKLNPYLMKENV